MKHNHGKLFQPSVQVGDAGVLELRKVVDQDGAKIRDFQNELRDVVPPLPTNMSMGGGTPFGSLLDVVVESVLQGPA